MSIHPNNFLETLCLSVCSEIDKFLGDNQVIRMHIMSQLIGSIISDLKLTDDAVRVEESNLTYKASF